MTKSNSPSVFELSAEHREHLISYMDINSIPVTECGCWIWVGQIDACGYGIINFKAKRLFAHRVAWAAHRGPISDGLFACHHCDIRSCVNPDHIFLGTHTDNMQDALKKGRYSDRRGTSNYSARLSEVQVREIRTINERGIDIARRYNISKSHVSEIRSGKSWGHL